MAGKQVGGVGAAALQDGITTRVICDKAGHVIDFPANAKPAITSGVVLGELSHGDGAGSRGRWTLGWIGDRG